MTKICVYCSSSNSVDPTYFDAARALGAEIAARGHELVFGGIDIGLMGALAHAAKQRGGRITGVVPDLARDTPYVFPADEIIYTPDLRSRKHLMDQRADAFVAMPGGFGTLDELFEVLALKQLTVHARPIVLFNHRGYYAPLVELFEHVFREKFASAQHHRQLYNIADSVDGLFSYIEAYQAPRVPLQWS